MGISIGMVGLGDFGRSFADLFKSHPLVDRIALCDREPERVKAYADKESWRDKLSEGDCFTEYDGLLRAGLDAIVIITQPWLHAPQAVQALESGSSVYSAVPIISVPDGDEILDWCGKLIRAVEKSGRQYMLGETTYYRPEAMFCRRMAAEGAFGNFVYSEGEYFHSFDEPGCDLRAVSRNRHASAAGREWTVKSAEYAKRGVRTGPMHYPTHSISGPLCVMKTRAVKVSCFGQTPHVDDEYFADSGISNETALFQLTNGTAMRVCEYRECSVARETFRVHGDRCTFEDGKWIDKFDHSRDRNLGVEEMRDPLPPEVASAFRSANPGADFYGGHGGSHSFLVNEFVDAVASDRVPAISIWEAARYMAAGVAAHKSALKGGELLDVPDFGDGPHPWPEGWSARYAGP